ncbi:tripartite tricarboxylate transporter substrate binding protein [Variovorax sp. J31P207]|uniref:Bug family tripartite tricarboxylate transporter substrate binding protein n=1 Tax=Variovorax sp. J31P207 TaxID=3053510 RepID=UPI0025758889|nr:tripartite tricarboxylate transporter substrate binding protein [Variovorax sp. J31P207]MDM0069980.1 tripartite tricarboxylate transporter substrate binding protein [Variovorax sp. J31P207]
MAKHPFRRRAVLSLLLAPLLAITEASADEFPSRPARIVVGFAPGTGMEVSTRLLADLMAKELGQPVIVETKPGASTMIAAAQVASAPKDGYTLLMMNNQTANNVLIYKKVPYKNSDFTAIAGGGIVSMVMAVSKTVPITTGREFLKYAKENDGKLFYGYWGAGGSPHLLAARLASSAGLNLQGVGYKDPGQATADLVTGRIHLFFTSVTHGLSLLRAGTANIVAVGTPQRLPSLPDVPTFAESGIEGMPNPWWGYGVPTGTPPAVVQKLERVIKAAVNSPRYQAMLASTGSIPMPVDSPTKFQEFIDQDQKKWAAAIRPLKLELD